MSSIKRALRYLDEPEYPFSEWVGSDIEEFGLVERAFEFLQEHPDATSSDVIKWLSDQDEFWVGADDDDDEIADTD